MVVRIHRGQWTNLERRTWEIGYGTWAHSIALRCPMSDVPSPLLIPIHGRSLRTKPRLQAPLRHGQSAARGGDGASCRRRAVQADALALRGWRDLRPDRREHPR